MLPVKLGAIAQGLDQHGINRQRRIIGGAGFLHPAHILQHPAAIAQHDGIGLDRQGRVIDRKRLGKAVQVVQQLALFAEG